MGKGNKKEKHGDKKAIAAWDEQTAKAVNGLRVLAADMVSNANSGHPGAPMGLAPAAYALFTQFMKHDPAHPRWINRDRFVLSNGHACALLYSVLHLSGYHFTLDDLKAFRQVGSKTPGHPEAGPTAAFDGIECTTGPLGQGLSTAVGFAIAERHLGATFNREGFTVVDNYTYVFCGDGCLQEGITSEASSLAGHLGLGKLVVLYDNNHITIDGETELSFTEDVAKRYKAYGWQVLEVEDGNHDLAGLSAAIQEAKSDHTRPTLIVVTTTIGFGSAKAGTEAVHGAPLGADDLANVKKTFGFDPAAKFNVPQEAYKAFDAKQKGADAYGAWEKMFSEYAKAFPDLAADLQRRIEKKLPEGWKNSLPKYTPEGKAEATRVSSGLVLNALAAKLPEIVGGSADLNPSTMTYLKMSTDFQKETPAGRNLRFGVREHAMAAVCNGLGLYGALIPFGSTFLNFIGYAFGAVILSSISHIRVLYVFTHDSIGLGEDGPTHQPVEKFMLCRSTPNTLFIRPADGSETVGAYIVALEHTDTPTVFALSRQALPQLVGSSAEKVAFGAYVLQDTEGTPDVILVGTGSEVSLCVTARDELKKQGVKARVVSFPSWELFEKQTAEYRDSVFPSGVPVLSVEAGTTFGWERYAHYSVGVPAFGMSGPAPKVYEALGITVPKVAEAAVKLVKHYGGKAPSKSRLTL